MFKIIQICLLVNLTLDSGTKVLYVLIVLLRIRPAVPLVYLPVLRYHYSHSRMHCYRGTALHV